MRLTITALLLMMGSFTFAQNAESETTSCEFISEQVDKFDGKVRINTPYLKPMQIIQYRKGTLRTTYLSLKAHAYSASVNNKGVIILFANGKRINKPAQEIDIDVDGDRYEYSAFMRLSPAEIALVKSSPITDYRLDVYDAEISKEDQQWYLGMFKCIFAH